MNYEHKELAWLTASEVEEAVRDFVREKGFTVQPGANVGGLWRGVQGAAPEYKNAVSVSIKDQTSEYST
jgi:hypothetical protein